MNRPKPVLNVADAKLMDVGGADGAFAAKIGRIGAAIGSTGIGCMYTVVPPGKKAFPFHVHHATNELFVILEGTGQYRFGDETHPVKAGDVLAAPAGKGRALAHQIVNDGTVDLKYLGISDRHDTDAVEYPDSGKFAVLSRFDWTKPAEGGLRFVGRADSAVDYYDGEK
ncbi:MAG: cupin domain-containing protein [Hyphomicrobiales bacterium]|nr:cupin domain-containing protein [Hyphomicrobiales bacterium]MDE2017773.1 cupin domain-containing protein [Hyphomicrobiales bacterium]